jgi:hypothetical protein
MGCLFFDRDKYSLIMNGSGLASVFYVMIIKLYPHALVHRLISEADISAGFATFLRLAIAQLLRIAQTKSRVYVSLIPGSKKMALKVLIWNTSEGKKGGKNGRAGHAALAITGVDRVNTNIETYISWWPNDPLKGKETKDMLRLRQGATQDIYTDFSNEMTNRTRAGLDGNRGPAWDASETQIGGPVKPANIANPLLVNRQSVRFENKMAKPFTYNEDSDVATRDAAAADRPEWLQAPDHIFTVPTLDCTAGHREDIGLSESDIKDWWQLYQTTNLKQWDLKISQNPANLDAIDTGWNASHHYRYVSRRFNCASIAMAGLLAGGAARFVDPPKPWVYFTPNDVRDYARTLEANAKLHARNARTYLDHIQSIQQFEQNPRSSQQFPSTVEKLKMGELQTKILFGSNADQENENYKKFMNEAYNQELRDQLLTRFQIKQKHVQSGAAFQDPVWTVDVWRRESYVGKLARRKEQVKQIDRLLPQYHALRWDIHDNAIQKSRILLEIIKQIQDHIINKPRSDRRDAILTLGAQCLNVLRNRPYDPAAVAAADPWSL